MAIVINIGTRQAPPAPTSPLTVGLVGTSIQAGGESAPTYGTYFDIPSIAEAEARFGTGNGKRARGNACRGYPPDRSASAPANQGGGGRRQRGA